MTGGGMADKTISLRYPTMGDYLVMFTIENNLSHCVSHASQAVTVNPTYDVNDFRSICSSELPYQWNGVWFNEAGVQEATLQTINGCDSVVTMTLTVDTSSETVSLRLRVSITIRLQEAAAFATASQSCTWR